MENKSLSIELSVRSLTKSFGNFIAVDSLSFDVYQGEIFGFLGPNGAGKTTTISMISGLLDADSGEILIRNRPIKDKGRLSRTIGMCPQHIVIWNNLTCLEQAIFIGQMYGMTKNASKSRALDLLNSMGLTEKKDSLAKSLSGGMKRRLNIILALIHDPNLIILDEPEAGLDPQSRVFVRDFIKGLSKKKTIIVTTHDMDEAERLADRIAIIDHGQLLVLDTPEALKKSMGSGEVLELIMSEPSTHVFEAIRQELCLESTSVSYKQDRLSILCCDAISADAVVTGLLKAHAVPFEDMRIRRKSLEDVFISLTGRGLRE